MTRSDEIKRLFDRMRAEVGSVPAPHREPEPAEEPRTGRPPLRRLRFVPRGARRPASPVPADAVMPEPRVQASEWTGGASRREERSPEHDFERNSVWDENKEILLFGMLASLVASLGGLMAGVGFLTLAGTAVFVVFSALTASVLFTVIFSSRPSRVEGEGVSKRVDALSKRVEMLSRQAAVSVAASSPGVADPGLERKVEELRMMVKGLSRSLGEGR